MEGLIKEELHYFQLKKHHLHCKLVLELILTYIIYFNMFTHILLSIILHKLRLLSAN